MLALAGCASSATGTSGTTAAASASGGSSGSSGGSATTGAATTASAASTTGSSGGSVGVIAEETAGPFPADGSNGVNVLTESGIVRQDIRSSFGSSSGTAEGVPSTVSYTVVDASTGSPVRAPPSTRGTAIGTGSTRSTRGASDQNYLRGVQETDANGVATFTTIYPACYSGRWPHIHFEVYPSLDEATAAGTPVATSQIALPEDVSTLVYATDGYEQSVQNLSQVSLSSDMVFSDGVETETPTVTGSVDEGYAIALTVGVSG